ncbi:MarR family winged helix-turn-helix transcriptional regulator [Conexibacter arvalis]|uniref:DNA-binding MarR family transcriptional regulator n=1 Tax=Conexibacter arvalis TaxID=912552 RepID=A0A840IEU6_9ACTN|nr:MarR family transcriptional regulator [Conexibacter arvalis]MBB4662594.1 DNA-binding MarR family transcriptional regulator [Conexibacter arvalis]
MCPPAPDAMHGVTFLMSKLGFHVSHRFAEAVAPLGLVPPHAGILRLVGEEPGQSQQALARKIGIAPNRLVALIDELERRELIRRDRSPTDRRVFALRLTAAGEEMDQRVRAIGAEHERTVTAALDDDERRTLAELLRRVAEEQGVPAGVHPGMRTLRAGAPTPRGRSGG